MFQGALLNDKEIEKSGSRNQAVLIHSRLSKNLMKSQILWRSPLHGKRALPEGSENPSKFGKESTS